MNSLGIDIKDNLVAIAYLKTSFKEIKLASHAIYSLEKEKALKEKLSIVRESVLSFIRENKIDDSADIFLGIPSNLSIFKEIEFPLAVKENLRATLKYEMEKHVPIPADDILFDYQILSEDKAKNRIKILLIVGKKNAILPYIDFSDTLAKGVSGIETDSTALANFTAYEKNIKNFSSDKELSDILKTENYKPKLSKINLPSDELICAFGLALKGLWKVPININLLPPELQKKPSKAGYYMMIILTVLLILSGFAWGGSYIFKKNLILKELDAEMKRLTSEIANIDKIQVSFKDLEDKINYLGTLQQNRVSALDTLRELTQIIPETAWIQDLAFSEKGIQISGYASSASELIPILENSLLFKDAVFLSTITKDKDGKEQFRIGFKLENVN